MDEKVKHLHPRLKKFVNNTLNLIHLNNFYEDYKSRDGVLDGYHFHIHLIQWFLNVGIEFDRETHIKYENIRYVKDLPEKDIKECLFYLNYLLGTTPQTGGHDYVKIYDKHKHKLSS
jgi:hypothetical protein